LGVALFMVYSAVNGTAGAPEDQIVVDETQALRLADQFQRTWMRLPTRQELQGLAEDFVKEEITFFQKSLKIVTARLTIKTDT
jgi:hypothetical protein